jgi:hypothetical protein
MMTPAVSHYYDDDKTVYPSVCLSVYLLLDCVFFCYYVPLFGYSLRLAVQPTTLLAISHDGRGRKVALEGQRYKLIHGA